MSCPVRLFIPFIIVLLSGIVAVWTGITVAKDHTIDDFKSHNHVPIVALVIGCVCLVISVSNLLRVFGCTGDGICNTGLGIGTYLSMVGSCSSLFIQYFKLSKDERTDFRIEHENYYYLAVGEVTFFIIYTILVCLQLICRCCGLCKSCTRRDDYDMDNSQPVFV